MVGVEGEHADHLTNTTAFKIKIILSHRFAAKLSARGSMYKKLTNYLHSSKALDMRFGAMTFVLESFIKINVFGRRFYLNITSTSCLSY